MKRISKNRRMRDAISRQSISSVGQLSQVRHSSDELEMSNGSPTNASHSRSVLLIARCASMKFSVLMLTCAFVLLVLHGIRRLCNIKRVL